MYSFVSIFFFFFFFNDTATTEIYTTVHTLSLHDALPIYRASGKNPFWGRDAKSPSIGRSEEHTSELQSRTVISYAVFCLKKKNKIKTYSTEYFLAKKNNAINKQK